MSAETNILRHELAETRRLLEGAVTHIERMYSMGVPFTDCKHFTEQIRAHLAAQKGSK